MKLFNVIYVWDVYCVAESPASAKEAIHAAILGGELPQSERTAIEARDERSIRAAWRDNGPLVAGDVSDADFETCKGQTTIEIQQMIYKRAEKAS